MRIFKFQSPRPQKCSIELKSQLDIDRDVSNPFEFFKLSKRLQTIYIRMLQYQYDFRVEREALSWQAI